MTDRHKHRPKAVRMPDGLLAWYETEAKRRGVSVNSLLVAALEGFLADVDAAQDDDWYIGHNIRKEEP